MLKIVACVAQQHDLGLVVISAGICLLGCFSTVTLMAEAVQAERRALPSRLVVAAAVFGCSVWSLHFVAMLAFQPGGQTAYDLLPTAASIAIAVAGALVALLIWAPARHDPLKVAAAGMALAASISGMHYTGVSAMAASSLLVFEDAYVHASLGLCATLGVIALARAGDLTGLGRRIEVTLWLALAICGLHFTGMTALTVAPAAPREDGGSVLGSTQLGLAVGLVSLVVLAAGLAALLMQRHLMRRSMDELSRMRLLGNLAHEVLFIHRDGRVVEINQAGLRLFETTAQEIIGRPILDLFTEAAAPALMRRSRCRPEDLRPEEFEIRSAAGTLVLVELSCRPIEYLGRPATAVALRDLSQRRRDEARIRHLALHDALTDLPNRTLLEERLGLALETAAENGTSVALVYLDLDRFKPVNDFHGHATGDALLVQAAKRMLAELRPTDTLARIGGDEFVIVLAHTRTLAQIAETAERLVEALGRPFQIEGQGGGHSEALRIEIGASAGIAVYPSDGSTAESLKRAADTALYRVKDEGRGAVRFFEAAMDEQLQARRRIEHELSGAIPRGELQLYYQPIVNGRTGEIETFEALIRWHHPERGCVLPAEFIPLAEQTDQIGRIGAWVLDAACAAAAAWPHPWRVSVNVSPKQFRQPGFAAGVAAVLGRHGLPPGRLVLEITEGVFIQDAAMAVEVLTALRTLGVRLALDDFGTGYSSLSYLQRFKFDKIKVDQSFVRRLGQHADSLTIVRAITHLGHNLGLQVTVEGVETQEQLAVLRELGCDQMQGYLFARPTPMTGPMITPMTGSSDLERARLRALFAELPAKVYA
ncbi:EAL domain-containing protein [Methylobacterium sp. R2-1]|uniref:bifunctional diguanylate cyclase/phosphodiesterase n=1 Tax=Methylobacterium sp. R2-1 TaxID=2587064 RepID=UPI00161292E9|nr:EAL domain-containing protein [Methylobacterium sp. R2-1]MBB2961988.1 diguanylate cyclase (GGDEF)-like protein/PAS domain S-box-containing protein [Methylobacterium sp. R2-1]